MYTIKVAEATDIQLDWLVAKCEGGVSIRFDGEFWRVLIQEEGYIDYEEYLGNLNFTSDWSQMGPIIERERIKLVTNVGGTWTAQIRHEKPHPLVAHKVLVGWTNSAGLTPLPAAARCYVASKLGEEVEIPKELMK